MNNDGRQKMNIRFPPPIARALGKAAKNAGRSANEQAVRYVTAGLEKDGFVVVETVKVPEVVKG